MSRKAYYDGACREAILRVCLMQWGIIVKDSREAGKCRSSCGTGQVGNTWKKESLESSFQEERTTGMARRGGGRGLSVLFPHPQQSGDHFKELAGSRRGCKKEGHRDSELPPEERDQTEQRAAAAGSVSSGCLLSR